jgi:hypothetical protein
VFYWGVYVSLLSNKILEERRVVGWESFLSCKYFWTDSFCSCSEGWRTGCPWKYAADKKTASVLRGAPREKFGSGVEI